MDRIISSQTKKKRWIRSTTFLSVALIVLITSVWGLRRMLEGRVDSRRLQTATAELADIENTLTASGEVLPAFEQVITSSIRADIQQVNLPVGSEVQPGTSILSLDKSFALLEFQKSQQELELKKNGLDKLRLELQKNLFDLQITDSIKALRINQLEAKLEDAKRLQQVGGGTQEDIDLAKLNLQIARLEKRQLEHDLGIQEQQTSQEW